MKNLSKKITKNLRDYGVEPSNMISLPLDFFENSQHHKDVVEFIRKKQEHDRTARLDMVFKALKSNYQSQAYYN